MANWNVLKAAVANIINANGKQEITGQLLQNVLNNIITSVGENATFAGIATLGTNPGAPDGPVFYLATAAGVYPNFNGLEVLDGEAIIFLWNNSAWTKKVTGFVTQEKMQELEENTNEKLSQLGSKIGVSVYSPINIDTKNKILDFGSDAVIEIGKQSYVLQNIHSEIAKYRAVPYYETNSGASKILFNLETKEIYPKVYTYISSAKEVLLGVVRSNYGTHELINASFPFSYTIDGQDVWNKSAMNWDVNVKGVNHRGWHEAPENTLIAFQQSKLHGFQYVECDVSFTSDNVPVLLHDSTIDRTSNAEGNIGDLTYEQVLEYDFGSWKDEKYVGLKIPTLEEFLKLCRNIGLTPYLELKNINDVEQVDIVVSQVKANGMRGKVTYISHSSSLLMRVKELDGSARLGVVVDEINEENISIAKSLRTERNDVFIDVYKKQSNIDKCIEESIPVECWTLNTYSEIVEANPYISGITSDRYIAGKVLYEKSV